MRRVCEVALVLVSASLLSDAFLIPQYHRQHQSASSASSASRTSLHSSSETCPPSHPPPSTILLLDVYNILGHTAFSLQPSALVSRAAAWRDSRDGCEPIAAVVDYGSIRCAHRHGPLADRVGLIFAGPSLTADDIIVSLVKERCLGNDDSGRGHNTTVVITADANLINRCQRQRREGASTWNAKSDLVFVEPASFLRELEKHTYADDDLFSGVSFDFPVSVTEDGVEKGTPEVEVKVQEENGGISCIDKSDKRMEYQEKDHDGASHDEASTDAAASSEQSTSEEDIVDTFMKETAVERTLNARARLVRDFSAKTKRRRRNRSGGRNSLSARQRNKLIAKQKRSQRRSLSAKETSTRMIQAEKLREKLVAAGTEQRHDMPVRTLLQWLAVPMDIGQEVDRTEASRTLLKWSAGADSNLSDPLSDLLRVPRRQKGPIASDDTSPLGRPLRAIVISDTHGFEAALSKLPNPEARVPETTDITIPDKKSEHHLLPDADILIHCGDFAANGSRMRQRESIRRLDSFFAHQKHIKHKIVVRGNHDPDTPGRVLFKKSKALYATTPFGLKIHGVKFALQPFSRRAHTSIAQTMQNLANADVLISHEPPSGVLDLTYSGMRVGSKVLRHAVETSKSKPRCWLCGHIHEGRGAAKEIFTAKGEECDDATLVVNAANANFGKANRLVSGAVLLDIEREALLDDDFNGSVESIESIDRMQLEAKDLGLEPVNVRPGVRRRKGVLRSGRPRRV